MHNTQGHFPTRTIRIFEHIFNVRTLFGGVYRTFINCAFCIRIGSIVVFKVAIRILVIVLIYSRLNFVVYIGNNIFSNRGRESAAGDITDNTIAVTCFSIAPY